ncbi:MAG: TlyA family RNA methyltransferase [Myxococcota bacterium]|nr:TlyA family RNA methyltransferase [Myxococcota bacterium]
MAKIRLDELLLRRELVETVQEARARIMAGEIIVGESRLDKAGLLVDENSSVRVRSRKAQKYVSRGGLKLEGALRAFEIDVSGLICLDLGASTGGFTDCLIRDGAKMVYAVDVGYGLLDWSLRGHDKVVCLERTHVADLTREHITEPIDLVVADLSFNSLIRLIPPVLPLLKPKASAVLLIKPQFEARKDEVGEKGIVTDPEIHQRVCDDIARSMEGLGARVLGLIESPIFGTGGNREFLIALRLDSIRSKMTNDCHDE